MQGGAVETLLTHLIRENEKQGLLDLLCASVPDDAARRAAEGWQHTKMLYVPRPSGHRRYWPMVLSSAAWALRPPMTRGIRRSSFRSRWSCPRLT